MSDVEIEIILAYLTNETKRQVTYYLDYCNNFIESNNYVKIMIKNLQGLSFDDKMRYLKDSKIFPQHLTLSFDNLDNYYLVFYVDSKCHSCMKMK